MRKPITKIEQGKKLSSSDRLAIAGIIVAIIYGTWGIIISKATLKTSVDIDHFNSLLAKTDTLLSKNREIIKLSNNEINSLDTISSKLNKEIDRLSFLQNNALKYERAILYPKWEVVDGISSYTENLSQSISIFNAGKRSTKSYTIILLPLNEFIGKLTLDTNEVKKIHGKEISPSFDRKISLHKNIDILAVFISYKDISLNTTFYFTGYYRSHMFNNVAIFEDCSQSEMDNARKVIQQKKAYKYLLNSSYSN